MKKRASKIFVSYVFISDKSKFINFGNSLVDKSKNQDIDLEWINAVSEAVKDDLKRKMIGDQIELVILNIQELK